jgi:subtilase family serine protease
VCDPAQTQPGDASCHALRLVDTTENAVNPMVTSSGALTPADIRGAYNLTSASSGGKTVAIVDAYGYPAAEADLGVFRNQYGLPACTIANDCLTIIDQNGGSKLPRYNSGWAGEQALDLDAVSATCPDCRILLVQASSSAMADLGAAVVTAARWPGVVAISNSYGGNDSADSSYGAYYNHPGIAVTASTGDKGYQGASYPASSHYVTAVGGTSLKPDANARGWSESAWSGAGSGCSTLNLAPIGQSLSMTGCSGRAMADVSAVADPNTGLLVYAPKRLGGSAWQQFGGTSLASPIIASVYAMSGNTSGYANQIVYAKSGSLYDITAGSNGSCGSTMCAAGTGWDGPTGLGTPNGTSGF